MKIAIITVSYNSEKTIAGTLLSVNEQTYKNVEHIIIDGASTDDTLKIVSTFSHKLIVISEPDNGIYDAMNKGIKAAKGDVIGILNSDDLYQDSTVIQQVIDQFVQDQNLDIVYGDIVYVKSDNVHNVVRNWKSNTYYKNFFENGNVPPHPSLFVRKKVYDVAGLFNLDFKLAADYEFMLRIFKKHNFKSKYLNKVIVKMRLGGATNQSFSNIKKQNKEILLAWKKNNLKAPLLLMPLRIIKRLKQFI